MDIIDKLNIDENYIVTEDNITLCIDKPLVLDKLPYIDPLLINNKYLTIENSEIIFAYFKDLLDTENSSTSVNIINGIYLDRDCDRYNCNYCKIRINCNWFYCYHCNKNMCKLCYEETSEEIALKNGSKKYKEREELLNKCRSFNKIQPINMYNATKTKCNKYCDICREKIVTSNLYSIKETYDTYDICLNCYKNNSDVRNIVETKSMKLIDINDKCNYYFGHTNFGSMLYWFPIIRDIEGCSVFINLNPNDINYRKICLQGLDNHGRSGYFIIRDDKYDLQKVLQRLKEICDNNIYNYEELEQIEEGIYENKTIVNDDGSTSTKIITIKEPKYEWITKIVELCKKPYSSPIHILMRELNMPLYYG